MQLLLYCLVVERAGEVQAAAEVWEDKSIEPHMRTVLTSVMSAV